MEAGRRQLGGDDAPDQPDRKSDMLGDDRPDQIASGDDLALGIPERLRLPGSSPKSRSGLCRSWRCILSTVIAGHARGTAARSGEAPVGRCSQIRMIGFRRTASMASAQAYSSFVPSLACCMKAMYRNDALDEQEATMSGAHTHSKFAICSILVRRTKIEHGHRRTRGNGSDFVPRPARETPRKISAVFAAPLRSRSRWHVDCFVRLLVNEDCGPPDVEAAYGRN